MPFGRMKKKREKHIFAIFLFFHHETLHFVNGWALSCFLRERLLANLSHLCSCVSVEMENDFSNGREFILREKRDEREKNVYLWEHLLSYKCHLKNRLKILVLGLTVGYNMW